MRYICAMRNYLLIVAIGVIASVTTIGAPTASAETTVEVFDDVGERLVFNVVANDYAVGPVAFTETGAEYLVVYSFERGAVIGADILKASAETNLFELVEPERPQRNFNSYIKDHQPPSCRYTIIHRRSRDGLTTLAV